MKQAVLISINPKWCELIATGKKTIEVRKTKPKLLPPFKCYIYETKGKIERPHGDEDGYIYQEGHGAVIGEFVCDWCDPFQPRHADFAELSLGSLVPPRELYEYAHGKTLYGWHITDLKLYAEPKKLGDFGIARAPQSWRFLNDSDKRI